MDTLTLLDQLAAGGTGIWFIAALSVLALAVALERFVRFRPAAMAPPGLVDAALPLWLQRDWPALHDRLQRERSALGEVLRFVLAHRQLEPAALSARAGDIAALALRRQQQRAYPLAVVATVAPLVGLLGTVVGMIEAFHVIATAGALGDPVLLAGGISKALVNTAAGLAVALPALALHHWFKSRLVAVGLELEAQINRLFDEAILPRAVSDAH